MSTHNASPTKAGHTDGASRLAAWFAAQCNGEREHMYGVTINTTDNPGWMAKVDIAESSAQDMTGRGSRDGFTWQIFQGQLWGYDEGTGNLEGLLTLMADLLEPQDLSAQGATTARSATPDAGAFHPCAGIPGGCEHDWKAPVDSQHENEVVCTKCGECGDLDRQTGEVFWPAT